MNNNQAQSNNATETETSKSKGFKMYKHKNGNTEITFNLPIKFFTGLKVNEAEARGQVRNEIWLALANLAEEIVSRSHQLLMQDYNNPSAVQTHAESLGLFGSYIRGYSSLLDELELYENHKTKEFSEQFKDFAETAPLDLSKMCKSFLGTNDTPDISEKQAVEPENLKEHTLGIVTDKISHVLESEKASDEVKSLIQDIIHELSNESEVYITHPKIIKTALPIIAEETNNGYFRGSLHSLQNILRNLSPELEEELAQYEKRFESKPTDIVNDLNDLAAQISELMKNPLLPDKLYNLIADEMNDMGSKVDLFAPENVLHNLELLRDSQGAK